MSNTIDHTCDKDSRISVLESKICRLEKDMKDQTEKLYQLDSQQDNHATMIIRIEAKMDSIEKAIKELIEERKQAKSFWRDKGVGLVSMLMGGIILAFLLVRFGLK